MLVIMEEVFEVVVYNLIKVVFENFDIFICFYLVFVNLKKEDMVIVGNFILFYLGVVKYYKEVGLIK